MSSLLRIITSIMVMLYIVAWLHYLMKKGSRGYLADFNRFLELERTANTTRKKEINAEFFIVPDIKKLPVRDYSDEPQFRSVKRRQALALKKSELTMLKFPEPKTNTELKFEFGIANLDKIIAYEENFNVYIRALSDWAEALISLNMYKEAEIILTEAVELGSEISKSYTLLGDLYGLSKDSEKLSKLCRNLSEGTRLSYNPQVRSGVLDYLESVREEL